MDVQKDDNKNAKIPSSTKIPSKLLLSGHQIPQLGLATWRNFKKLNYNGWHTENPFRAVQIAIENGISHLDGAEVYLNQNAIGKAIRNFSNRKVLERSSLFIASKIWNTHHSTTNCHESIDRALRELRVEYLDMMLIHYPQGFAENHEADERDDIDYVDFCELFPNDGKQFLLSNVDFLETWRVMEQAVDQGKIRSIGVANFDLEQLKRLWEEARIKPSYLQINIEPGTIHLEIQQFCQQKGILIGVLTPGKGSRTLESQEVQMVAARIGKTPLQVLLRWYIEHDFIILPKFSTSAEILESLAIFDFQLTPDQVSEINGWNDTTQATIRTLPAWPFDKKVVKTRLCEVPKLHGIPRLGLSTQHLSAAEILSSLKHGCRHIDVEYVDFPKAGQVLTEIASSGIRRKHCHVTVRIFPSFKSEAQFHEDFQWIQETLNTSFINLLLVQWPRYNELHRLPGGVENLDILKTWRLLEQEVNSRRIGAIGMCHFSKEQVQFVLENSKGPGNVTPKVLELELNPLHSNPELLEFCDAHDIMVIGHAPFGGGNSPRRILDHPEIQKIAQEVEKSTEQVVLRWVLEHGAIPVVDRFLEDYTKIFSFELTAEQIKSIDNLNIGWSCSMSPLFKREPLDAPDQ